MWSRPAVSMKHTTTTHSAGMMRKKRFHRYWPTRGAGRPSSAAAAHGRYSNSPDSMKKMGTPTWPPLNNHRAPAGLVMEPAALATWNTRTPSAATARTPSSVS